MARIAMRSAVVGSLITMALGGCCSGPEYATAPGCQPQPAAMATPPVAVYANPVLLPIADHQCAWEQVVDVIDDYFRIEHEEMADGSITTVAEVSPTIFEPWRHDTADPDQRIENTLQTMRRRAVVRVIPAQGGHSVEVQVFKELENLVRPEQSTAGAAAFRYDSTLSGVIDPIAGQQATLGWIPQGRDTSLEQYIIGDLLNRCGQPGAPVVMRGQSDDQGKR